jgi:hypothetical protein
MSTKTKRKPAEDFGPEIDLPARPAAESGTGDDAAPAAAAATDAAETPARPPAPSPTARMTIVIPYDAQLPPNATVAAELHLNVQLRRVDSRRAFKAVWSALLRDKARLASGRPVIAMSEAVQWIVERIAEGLHSP